MDELEKLIQALLDATDMTEEQATALYERLDALSPQEWANDTEVNEWMKQASANVPDSDLQAMVESVSDYTSEKDLLDRITALGVDKDTAAKVWDAVLPPLRKSGYDAGGKLFINDQYEAQVEARKRDLAFREARGRAVEAERKRQEQAAKAQVQREGRAGELSEALNRTLNNRNVRREDLAGIRDIAQGQAEEYLGGKNDNIMTMLKSLSQQAEARNQAEGLRARQLMGIADQPREAQTGGMTYFPMPDAYETVKPYMDTGLPEGSKLRNFLESGIESAYRETMPAREAWQMRQNLWSGMSLTYGEERARRQAELDRWSGIAGSAPSSTYAGDVYYGEGGLKAIAEEAARNAQESLEGLQPYQSATRMRPYANEQDPLIAAARKKRENLKADYYRQPGTGIVPRLQRSLRIR